MNSTMTTSSNSPRTFVKHYRNGFGSADRVQRNYYAFLVMVAIMGAPVCPSCEVPFTAGDFDVDRINGNMRDDNGSELYVEGTFVYLCKPCNQSRAVLQSVGSDWNNVDAYRNLVTTASATVTMPTVAAAKAWWATRQTGTVRVSRFA